MDHDLILVGGGLTNSLIALRLSQRRPDLSVAIVERSPSIDRHQIWSSFSHDVSPEQQAWTQPLVAYQWDRYSVRFPSGTRTFDATYRTIDSGTLATAVRAALAPGNILVDSPVAALDATSVTLADQRVLTARAVIDGRGLGPNSPLDLRWQKFVGIEIDLEEDHDLSGPIVMDATVAQHDGYRFVYTLPLGPRRLLVEDTYFSDDEALAPEAIHDRVLRYAEEQGWHVARIVRSEGGVLPMALGGEVSDLWDASPERVALVGLRAGLFQPATGYSFADAVRTADLIAALPDIDSASIYAAQRDHSETTWKDRAYYRYLNTLMFLGSESDLRYRVIERFYQLRPGLVHRFYAGRSTPYDKARIMIGKPPIPIGRAVAITLSVLRRRWNR